MKHAGRTRRLRVGATLLVAATAVEPADRGPWPLVTLAWGGLWIVIHDFPRGFAHVDDLVDAYRHQRYAIAEGDVKVLHAQPRTGHTKGDIVRIGDAELQINYFHATPAYRDTIAHGGVLKDGTHARVYHYHGEILRIDVGKP